MRAMRDEEINHIRQLARRTSPRNSTSQTMQSKGDRYQRISLRQDFMAAEGLHLARDFLLDHVSSRVLSRKQASGTLLSKVEQGPQL